VEDLGQRGLHPRTLSSSQNNSSLRHDVSVVPRKKKMK
jgi:hypothetical protein